MAVTQSITALSLVLTSEKFKSARKGEGGVGVEAAVRMKRSLGFNCEMKQNIRCHQFTISRVANIILAPAVLRKDASLMSLLLDPWIMSFVAMHFNNLWQPSLRSRSGAFVEQLLYRKGNKYYIN